MEWNEKLQKIIDYVENHLQREESPIDMEEISKIAQCSPGFYQKVFSYMNGISFAEYVRFRKLTLAGYDLKSTKNKVVDISYKYGYDSPTSFTKAFWQFHGVTPKEAREGAVELRVFPKMQISQKQQYSWRLEQKPPFRLIGKSIRISSESGPPVERVPEFWNECQRNGDFCKLISMDTAVPHGLFGLFGYDAEDFDGKEYPDEIEYSIMVASDKELPKGFREIFVPEATWAVFDCHGPAVQAIQSGWKFITQEWVVKYPFAHAACPEIEWYSEGNSFGNDYLTQIWIPVLEEDSEKN